MKEFSTAVAREGESPQQERDSVTFIHDEREVTFYEPSSGQLAIMSTVRASKEIGMKELRVLMGFFFGMMDEETAEYFEDRMMDPLDILSDIEAEGGMLDIMDYLQEEWSGKVSKQPSDYQESRKQTGRSSTGSTRAKASTSSHSRTRASSTSSKSGS